MINLNIKLIDRRKDDLADVVQNIKAMLLDAGYRVSFIDASQGDTALDAHGRPQSVDPYASGTNPFGLQDINLT